MKDHTKPICHKHKILAFKKLYNYQICLETLKILKTKIPYYLFQLHLLSSRNNQNFLVTKRNSSLFITNRIKLWNICLKVIFKSFWIDTRCLPFAHAKRALRLTACSPAALIYKIPYRRAHAWPSL